MRTETLESFNKDRRILIAVDNSENAERAILYVADSLGGVSGFYVTILTVIPEPPADYFETATECNSWIEEQKSEATRMLDKYRQILIQSGFVEDKVETIMDIRKCPSVADCIIDVQQKLKCCTIVIGRRGVSKKEEFLFGSTSSKIVRSGKNCAVWVIE
ncbi:MAG TPA: universal stress protein [Syntrophales bacterium]|nr:universal stress protein [Syntrophales bacterium]